MVNTISNERILSFSENEMIQPRSSPYRKILDRFFIHSKIAGSMDFGHSLYETAWVLSSYIPVGMSAREIIQDGNFIVHTPFLVA